MIGTTSGWLGSWRVNLPGMGALAVLVAAVALWCPARAAGASHPGAALAGSETRPFVGDNDRRLPVLADAVLTWNTFLGGSGSDLGYGIAVDNTGSIYLVGHSLASWGSPVRAFTGSGKYDVFVAKLDSNGALLWNTFLGGASHDYGSDLAVDSAGNVCVTGYSEGTWGVPVNGYAAGEDVFVAKLASNGVLLWNTFLGGSGDDFGDGITVDGSGSTYVTGHSSGTWGAPLNPYAAGWDAFAAQVATNGSFTWNTFLGSSASDRGFGITTDGTGSLYLAGSSAATWGVPVRPFTLSPSEIFVAKLLAVNGSVVWNTFLGGTGADYGEDIAVDSLGNAYIAGYSYASWGSPARAFSAVIDGTVAKVSCTDGALAWNTFLGGSGFDRGYAVSADAAGNVYATGESATLWGAPTISYTGGDEAFAAGLAASDGSLRWNDFLGADSNDYGSDVAAVGGGRAYVIGHGIGTWGSPLIPHANNFDAFVATLMGNGPVITRISSRTSTPGSAVTIRGTGFSADKLKNVVSFGSKKATINSATTTKLKVTIPRRIKKGTVDVSVLVNGLTSNLVAFQVK